MINLNDKEPFFAIANFENALAVVPSDSIATEKLILSYEMLCQKYENNCAWAEAMIDSLRQELPSHLN